MANSKIKRKYPKYVEKVYFEQDQIEIGIQKAAKWIDINYKNKTPILVAVLKGAIPFYGNLLTKIKVDVICDFIVMSSFKGQIVAQSKPEIVTDLISDIKQQHIVVIEDIVDTGRSMKVLKKWLIEKGAKSVKVISLVDKPEARKVKFDVDYKCFDVPGNAFLIGYGLDFKEKCRNLPYIAELNKKYINSF